MPVRDRQTDTQTDRQTNSGKKMALQVLQSSQQTKILTFLAATAAGEIRDPTNRRKMIEDFERVLAPGKSVAYDAQFRL